jgi:hypothetical protein
MQQPYRQQGRAGQFNGKLPLPGQVSHEQHRSPLGRVLAFFFFERRQGTCLVPVPAYLRVRPCREPNQVLSDSE